MTSASSSSMGRPRVMTPRPASAGASTPTPTKTPYSSLRQLAGLIAKPSTLDPSSKVQSPTSSLPRRTPSAGRYTPGTRAASRHVSIRRGTPTTPHTMRALQHRRAAALAVERTRRRSGRQQRETPRDTLRNLSRILAKDSEPIESSPIPEEFQHEDAEMEDDVDDLEDGSELVAPRLSLPLGDDEDSFQLPPEGTSVHLNEDNLTVELPRRAYNEQLGGGRSRASFGSIRMSDRFAGHDELEVAESPEREDVAFDGNDLDGIEGDGEIEVEEDEIEDEDEDAEGEQVDYDDDLNTRDLGRAYSEELTRRESGVQSVAQPEIMDESTFAFTVPQPRERVSPSPERSPEREAEQPAQAVGDDPMEQVTEDPQPQSEPKPRPKKVLKISRHGIPYPSLPVSVVKKLATTFVRSSGAKKTQLSKETLEAVMEASDWFFEQVSDDLGAYARHAGRRMINGSDMITLMKRQRQVNAKTTPFSLAQRYLPRELLQEIRMPPTEKPRRRRKQELEDVEEVDEEE